VRYGSSRPRNLREGARKQPISFSPRAAGAPAAVASAGASARLSLRDELGVHVPLRLTLVIECVGRHRFKAVTAIQRAATAAGTWAGAATAAAAWRRRRRCNTGCGGVSEGGSGLRQRRQGWGGSRSGGLGGGANGCGGVGGGDNGCATCGGAATAAAAGGARTPRA
jgi:hypothetical protein